MGGDSPTAQQAALSGLEGSARRHHVLNRASNRGRIKIQEDRSPKTILQVRNFALTSFAFYPERVT
jgi:hypothetical protein